VAQAEGASAVVVRPGPLGDAVVLAAGLSSSVVGAGVLVGALVDLGRDGRHPALVARDLTGLDHVSGGRSIVACPPPFDDALAEALALCRTMWREGHAASDGPAFPVSGARHHPRPRREGGPAVALDLTAGGGGGDGDGDGGRAGMGPGRGAERAGSAVPALPAALRELADFVLWPTDQPSVCRMERA